MKSNHVTIKVVALALLFGVVAPIGQANSFTLKTGEVLGSDGQVYEGASPDEKGKIIEKAKSSSKTAGIHGNNVFVVVQDSVTFVPLSEIRGKTNESVEQIIIEAVSDTLVNGQLRQLETIEGEEVIASEAEVSAALDEMAASDVAGITDEAIAEITRDAFEGINQSDLKQATEYATQFAAKEAAKVAAAEVVADSLQEIQEAGASAAEVEAFMRDNPAPSGHCDTDC